MVLVALRSADQQRQCNAQLQHWVAGDLVFIRIKRDHNTSSVLDKNFLMTTAMQIQYQAS